MANAPQTLTALAVTTTAVQVTSTNGEVQGFAVTPTDGTVYLVDSTGSAANGTPILSGVTATVMTSYPSNWYLRTASGTVNVRVMLLKG